MMGVNTGISFARSMSDVEPYMRLSAAVVQMAVRDYGKAVRAGDERHAQKIHADVCSEHCAWRDYLSIDADTMGDRLRAMRREVLDEVTP